MGFPPGDPIPDDLAIVQIKPLVSNKLVILVTLSGYNH
jgi:hypothetical protein